MGVEFCAGNQLWRPRDLETIRENTALCAWHARHYLQKPSRVSRKRKAAAPAHLSQIILGDAKIGERLISDPTIALVSATGSTRMGTAVGPRVAERFGKSLLELGGNNAIIVSDKADLKLALNAVLFGAVGTAGQRCTTTRRVIAHKSIYEKFFSAT